MIHHGDLFDILPTLAEASIDACVTDGPYGIGFMGREWDTFKPGTVAQPERYDEPIQSDNPNLHGRRRSPAISPSQIEYDYTVDGLRRFQAETERWAREVLRVLKPGAYLLSCGAPRAFHRMTCGLEDAGFEIRDCLSWFYGQGFPKSLNIAKAIDRHLGAPQAVSGLGEPVDRTALDYGGATGKAKNGLKREWIETAPNTADAAAWVGWGTALKPAWEPIVLARKPFNGTIAHNVLQHGTAALNVAACRMGRWPANVLLDEEAAALLDEQTGELVSGANPTRRNSDKCVPARGRDVGGASRFYYVAKPSREERDFGCFDLPERSGGEATDRKDGSAGLKNPRAGAGRGGGARNIHPTVKPVELMRWLVRLVTPPGGAVLDPFMGSGTTGMACRYEHRQFIGIEREAEYIAIAERRIAAVAPLFREETA